MTDSVETERVDLERLAEVNRLRTQGEWRIEQAPRTGRVWLESEYGNSTGICDFYHSVRPRGYYRKPDDTENAIFVSEWANSADAIIRELTAAREQSEVIARLVEALDETEKDLIVLSGNIYDANKTDHRWDGMYERVRSWIDRLRTARDTYQSTAGTQGGDDAG